MQKILLYLFILLGLNSTAIAALPDNFVYLKDISPSIVIDMRYFSSNNFIGRRITGYHANRCILTLQAALALSKVQKNLQNLGYGLVVYDCYRPRQAVSDFYQWSQTTDKRMKSLFYPREKKEELFKRGYIARYSAHSRGSTVDLGLYKNQSKRGSIPGCYQADRIMDKGLDMGTNFDCLDPNSRINSKKVSVAAIKNRNLLIKNMKKEGFKPYSKEWWHYSLKNEPYKKRYFNFPVK